MKRYVMNKSRLVTLLFDTIIGQLTCCSIKRVDFEHGAKLQVPDLLNRLTKQILPSIQFQKLDSLKNLIRIFQAFI